jgi:Tol biopolymer transport system component
MTTMWSHCSLRWLSGPAVMLLVVACGDSEMTSPSSGALRVAPPTSTGLAATGHIAFVRNADIYIMNADGSGVTQLTHTSAAAERQPAWSPDGKKLAFVSNRVGNDEIYTMNADGTGVIRVTHDTAGDSAPSWSPDGTKIAFRNNDQSTGGIYVMKVDGKGVTRLTGGWAPAWSPNGAKIAFLARTGPFCSSSIYIMKSDGSEVTPIAGACLPLRLSWSRTGKIAFDPYHGAPNREIVAVNADGSGRTFLTFNTVQDESPSWSPDGTRIAFVSNRNQAGSLEIYVMDANGKGVTRLTHSGGTDPAWGP